MKHSKLNGLERDLIAGLGGLVDDLKSGKPIAKKYNYRRIVLDLAPKTYGPTQIRAIRKLLRISQGLFAQFLGVSIKTVRAWEQGKPPSEMACRFMDEIGRNPDYWRKRLAESAGIKTR